MVVELPGEDTGKTVVAYGKEYPVRLINGTEVPVDPETGTPLFNWVETPDSGPGPEPEPELS